MKDNFASRASRTFEFCLLMTTATFVLATGAIAQEAETLPEITVEAPADAPKQKKYPTPKIAKKSKPAPAEPAEPAPAPSSQSASAPQPAPQLEPQPAPEVIPGVAVTGGVIGGDREGLKALKGSGAVVDGEELYQSHVFTTNEALRKVPGVHVRDEEGFGIRPNIAIRGLNPTRSTKVLLLEDGLFLTYAPYGDNASYFHPSLDRYDRIEVIKGADLLLYGPHTISGAINYVTPNPPRDPSGFVAGTVGNRDYANGQLYYGGWYENFGGQIDYVHKEGKGARDNTDHKIEDFGAKAIAQVSPEAAFIAKASYFREDSNVTYSGITDAEARNFGIRYNPFDNDEFNTERIGTSLTLNWDMAPGVNVATSVYYNTFSREWWRQASTTTDGQCGAAFTANRLNGIAVNPDTCNSIQGRLRDYYAYGLDQRWNFDTTLMDGVLNNLKVGWRVHSEEQDRIQENGTNPFIQSGAVVEDNERDATAISLFAQNKLSFGDFSVTPAVRYEDIRYTRQNNLAVGGCAAPPCRGESDVSEVIPGISIGYTVSAGISVFAGVHEGFSPPRVEDAIGNAGGSVDVDPESSTNFEAGIRSEIIPGFKADATYFHNDFDNLVAVGSVAGGNVNLAQGEALFEGLELAVRADSARLAGTAINIYGQLAWTYLWTAEQSTPFIRVDNGLPVAGNTAGNRQPYAPEHLITARLGVAWKNWDGHIEMVFVDEQFADFQNFASSAAATAAGQNGASGLFGKIDDYMIFNLGMTYTIEHTNTDLFFTVKNLFDEEYITDRTRGILPGAPRLVHFGLKQSF